MKIVNECEMTLHLAINLQREIICTTFIHTEARVHPMVARKYGYTVEKYEEFEGDMYPWECYKNIEDGDVCEPFAKGLISLCKDASIYITGINLSLDIEQPSDTHERINLHTTKLDDLLEPELLHTMTLEALLHNDADGNNWCTVLGALKEHVDMSDKVKGAIIEVVSLYDSLKGEFVEEQDTLHGVSHIDIEKHVEQMLDYLTPQQMDKLKAILQQQK